MTSVLDLQQRNALEYLYSYLKGHLKSDYEEMARLAELGMTSRRFWAMLFRPGDIVITMGGTKPERSRSPPVLCPMRLNSDWNAGLGSLMVAFPDGVLFFPSPGLPIPKNVPSPILRSILFDTQRTISSPGCGGVEILSGPAAGENTWTTVSPWKDSSRSW